MFQKILITTGIVLALIVFGIWIYLLIFGTPESTDDLFADLGFTGSNEEVPRGDLPAEPFENNTRGTIDVSSAALAQLSTRPIAGFGITSSTSTADAFYVERGVGHVYQIDLRSGIEKRVLSKTFTSVTEAVFSPNATAVALVATSEGRRTTTLLALDAATSTRTQHDIPVDAANLTFLSDTKLAYTRTSTTGTIGHIYNLLDGTTTTEFTIPLTAVTVLWTETETFVYPRPAPYLSGALYSVNGTTLTRVGESGYGLSALAHPTDPAHLITEVNTDEDTLVSAATNAMGALVGIPITAIPEKCTFAATETTTLWCAAPVTDLPRTYQIDWYKGAIVSDDELWKIDTTTQRATVIVDLRTASGRIVDIIDPAVDATDSYLLFRNKIDNTLWMYRIDE